MLVFMEHTGVTRRLSIWKASLKFEGLSVKRGRGMLIASHFTRCTSPSGGGRWCETNPICRDRAGPATVHPQGYREITPYGVTTNGTWTCETNPIPRRRSERQVFFGNRFMAHSAWKRRWENEANCPLAPSRPAADWLRLAQSTVSAYAGRARALGHADKPL